MGIQVDSLFRNAKEYNKSFINFSYGGKNVYDFGFVVSSSNDGLTRPFYADFDDTTSDSVGVDGQMFWLTTLKPLELGFELATDGVNEKQISKMTSWLRPGVEQELILSERPNRAILARLRDVPEMDFVPFTDMSNGFPITIYKGTVKIRFIMDDPYWYTKEAHKDKAWSALNESEKKYIYEDDVLINGYSTSGQTVIVSSNDYESYATYKDGVYTAKELVLSNFVQGAQKIYYSGTAIERPIVKEKINYSWDSNNRLVYNDVSFSLCGRTITHGLPDRFSSCVDVYTILDNLIASGNNNYIDWKEKINDNIKHKGIRKAALEEIDFAIESGTNTTTTANNIVTSIKSIINSVDNNNPYVLTIDSESGKCYLTFGEDGETITEPAGNIIKTGYPLIYPTGKDMVEYNFSTNSNSINVDNCQTIEFISDGTIKYIIAYRYKYY